MEELEVIPEYNETGKAVFPFPKRDPLYIVIPMTILYSTILLTGVLGNVITCIVIARNKHMHTATNYYLFSLAVSDLLLLVTGLPQEMYYIWSRYPYIFGEAFCIFRGLAAETSTNATVLTITAFTIERYVAICHPFLSHTMSKPSRAFRLILLIWIIAFTFAIPQAIQFGILPYEQQTEVTQCALKFVLFKHSFVISSILFFIVPMSIITILYALIGLRLRRSALLKKASGSFSHHQENRKLSCKHSSQRVLKMLVAVVVAFFICWAPFHTQRLVAYYSDNPDHFSPTMIKFFAIVTYISGILFYVSTTVNPILYQIMSLKFREAFKDTLASCCCIKNLRSYETLSKRKRVLETRAPRERIFESITDSGNSGECDKHRGKSGNSSSQSSYVVNDSVVPLNQMMDVTVKTTKNGRKTWISCITHGRQTTDKENKNRADLTCSRHRKSLASNISNTSLKDIEKGAIEDELTTYIREINLGDQRQEFIKSYPL